MRRDVEQEIAGPKGLALDPQHYCPPVVGPAFEVDNGVAEAAPDLRPQRAVGGAEETIVDRQLVVPRRADRDAACRIGDGGAVGKLGDRWRRRRFAQRQFAEDRFVVVVHPDEDAPGRPPEAGEPRRIKRASVLHCLDEVAAAPGVEHPIARRLMVIDAGDDSASGIDEEFVGVAVADDDLSRPACFEIDREQRQNPLPPGKGQAGEESDGPSADHPRHRLAEDCVERLVLVIDASLQQRR